MTRITAVWTLSLLLLSGVAAADPEPWMKKENPDELDVLISLSSNCPTFDLETAVNGVLIRSRIRPVSFRYPEKPVLYLNVAVNCFEYSNQSNFYSFNLDIRFGTSLGEIFQLLYEWPKYNTTGHGDGDYIEDSVKSHVESAITDYLQANFDL